VLSALVLWNLWGYGIWDPWELGIADDARHLLAGEPVDAARPPLAAWLVARGFGLFGVHEWSGRLPVALAALLMLGLAASIGRLYGDLRRGTYLAMALATTPLFLLNARHMMGGAPAFLLSGLVFTLAAGLAFPSRALATPAWRAGLAIGLVVTSTLSAGASGVLLGVAPPLAAVGAAVVSRLPWDERPFAVPSAPAARMRFFTQLAVVLVGALVAVGTVAMIAANQEGYSIWTGGSPRGQTPPTFEIPVEALFHSFAPWSAILPLAVGFVMTHGSLRRAPGSDADAADDETDALRGIDLAALAWVGLALAAQSVHAARYGDGAFVAVLGLAWIVASFLRSTEQTSRGESWARGLVVVLLAGLLIRDFRGYPGYPWEGLFLRPFTFPEVFTPAVGWAITLGMFGAAAFFALASDVSASRTPFVTAMGASSPGGALLRAFVPIDLVRAQWARGRGFRAWLVAGALLLSVMLGFGLVSVVLRALTSGADDESLMEVSASAARTLSVVAGVMALLNNVGALVLHLRTRRDPSRARLRGVVNASAVVWLGLVVGAVILAGIGANSLALRVGMILLAVPFGVLAAIGGARIAYHLLTSLGSWTLVPTLTAAVFLAAWFVVRFHPQASAHFSPREVYDSYNALAAQDEPLGEYQVGGRAAAYYARGEIVELRTETDALAFLARPTRVWLALPAEQLAQIDRAYRARAERHLFVADARNARVLLATNQPIEGRADENYLAGFVLDAPPPMQHTVNGSFDRRIELLGYDLHLPGGDSVGPGQAFEVTWYWRCVTPVPGGYQPFLHIDGFGQRLNGDHEPVGGRYPVRMWSEGDVVVDRHELRVPANYPPGDYTFYIGLYSGESRLEVVSGPEDDANRVAAGRLRVR